MHTQIEEMWPLRQQKLSGACRHRWDAFRSCGWRGLPDLISRAAVRKAETGDKGLSFWRSQLRKGWDHSRRQDNNGREIHLEGNIKVQFRRCQTWEPFRRAHSSEQHSRWENAGLFIWERGKKKGWVEKKNHPIPPSPASCSFCLLSSVLLHASYPSLLTGWNDPKPDIGSFLAF